MKKSNFSKKFFIPFLITTYVPRALWNCLKFRIKSAPSSNYRGTSFFPLGVVNLRMNNDTLKNIEFIRTTAVLCCLRFGTVFIYCMFLMLASGSTKYVIFERYTLPAKRCPLYAIHSTKQFVRNFQLFLRNKPNFPHFSPKNEDHNEKQTQFKPNSNPIC
jgi:hypothetical protein